MQFLLPAVPVFHLGTSHPSANYCSLCKAAGLGGAVYLLIDSRFPLGLLVENVGVHHRNVHKVEEENPVPLPGLVDDTVIPVFPLYLHKLGGPPDKKIFFLCQKTKPNIH